MGIIHDGFIKHGVEPVTNGTRYSLIVFFAVGKVQATFTNHESEDILVYWQNPDADAEVLEVRIAPGENAGIISHPEHVHKVRFEVRNTQLPPCFPFLRPSSCLCRLLSHAIWPATVGRAGRNLDDDVLARRASIPYWAEPAHRPQF
jgi:hypothetical protein